MATATAFSLRCERKSLLHAFGAVSSCVPTKSPKPILQSIKLTTTFGGVTTIQATDLEVVIRCDVPAATPSGAGSLILPAAKVNQILKASDDEYLKIESDGDKLTVRGDRSRFVLPSEDPDLFPEMPDFPDGIYGYHSVSAADLRRLIQRTWLAIDPASTRFALGGVLFEFGDVTLTAVGTDSRRLARAVAAAETFDGADSTVLASVVPPKALKLLDRALSEAGQVLITVDPDRAIYFRTEDWTIYSRLVEGRFPRYQDAIPAKATANIPVSVGPLLAATQQATIVTSEESRGVDFRFDCGMLSLSSQAPDAGSSTVDLPIDYDGQPIEITFDPRYLIDALKVLDESSSVSIDLIDAKNAAVLKTEDDYTYVVMPLTPTRA